MEDSGATLLRRANEVIAMWLAEVERGITVGHDERTTYETVRSNLPLIIAAIAANLSAAPKTKGKGRTSLQEPPESIMLSVEQGFDIDELMRELSTLRPLVMTTIGADFSRSNSLDAALSLRKVDDVLDSIVLLVAKQHAECQLERAQLTYSELLSDNQSLIRAVQTQQDNAAQLAHKLKNPIHAIVSFSALMLRKKQKNLSKVPSESKEIKQLERIHDNGQQLSQLVDDMLEISSKEAQRIPSIHTTEDV